MYTGLYLDRSIYNSCFQRRNHLVELYVRSIDRFVYRFFKLYRQFVILEWYTICQTKTSYIAVEEI